MHPADLARALIDFAFHLRNIEPPEVLEAIGDRYYDDDEIEMMLREGPVARFIADRGGA